MPTCRPRRTENRESVNAEFVDAEPVNTVRLIAAITLFALALYFLVIAQMPLFRGDPQAVTGPTHSGLPSFSPNSLYRELPSIPEAVIGEIAKPLAAQDDASRELKRLLSEGEFKLARALLMDQAADAAIAGNRTVLGGRLLMLGQIAIEEQDLDAAAVYLLESLATAEGMNDPRAIAHVNHQLGRMHLRARQLARSAGEAYDLLLVARNELARGQFVASREKLLQVIDSNLAIRRYGAAASAYQSMARLHRQLHETYLAEIASVEAAKLYARSGQSLRAGKVVDTLRQNGSDAGRIYYLEEELAQLDTRFRQDVKQVEQARDYQRLYRHYAAAGNNEQAWKLRVLASQSLAKTAKRSLYHRQADVLAVLYDSNSAVTQARSYLELASSQFEQQGLQDLSGRSTELASTIY